MLKAKNNSDRIKQEFGKLRRENRPLAMLLIDLYHYVDKKFQKDVVMTMIYRTQDEQDAIYRNNPRYEKRPFKSPHQFWHAVDIRSRTFSDDEIEDIENYLNSKYNDSNYYKWTARCHKVGDGAYHFHIQYYKA